MQKNITVVAQEFVNFLNRAVSPYHAVDECVKLLSSAGFKELKECDVWKLEPSEKYYVTKNKSTIIAFAVGGRFRPGNGMAAVAAHTDSPGLRVKPVSKVTSAGCLQVGVMTYGGGIWRSWFDRDLTVAGRLLVKDKEGKIRHVLINVEKPIMSIPSLAIHLSRDSNEKFCMNKEDHLRPILATQVVSQLVTGGQNDQKSGGQADQKIEETTAGFAGDHHEIFLKTLAANVNRESADIVDFDLCVIDTQPAQIGGLHEEFVYGARLDNLVNTFASITALIKSCTDRKSLDNDTNIRLAACYDNEECGSQSAQGAGSALTEWIMRRLQNSTDYVLNVTDAQAEEFSFGMSDKCCFERAIAKSFLISADQAHGVHPNYKSKHEENHSPNLHKGVVIKVNANQRYATTTITSAFLQKVAEKAKIPFQKYVVRNDSECGSTVGPILSAKLGLQTVDMGTPQFAMHSAREMACTSGIFHAQQLFTTFYESYNEIRKCFDL